MVTTSPEPAVVVVPATGTLTVRWTVAGTADPLMCSAYAASNLELIVYDESGTEIASANAPCHGFSVTMALPEGTYTAHATLIDSAGGARSTTKPLFAIDVVRGTDLAIDLDFPASSML
jgi:hypothetical protein